MTDTPLTDEQIAVQMRVIEDAPECMHSAAFVYDLVCHLQAARIEIADLKVVLADAHAEIEAQQAQWDAAQATRIELGGVWVYPPRNHH